MTPDKKPKPIAGFGGEFKRDVRRWYGTSVRLAAHGEMLPGPGKFVELDQETKDKWGLPVLKIHHPLDDNDRKMLKHIRQTYEEILTAAGAVNIKLTRALVGRALVSLRLPHHLNGAAGFLGLRASCWRK